MSEFVKPEATPPEPDARNTKCLKSNFRWGTCLAQVFYPYGIHLAVFAAVTSFYITIVMGYEQAHKYTGRQTLSREPCAQEINDYLTSLSEINKVASSVASTIMTLVPVLLAFAPLPTAKISSLITFSTSAAIATASMKFGISTTSISTLAEGRVIRVKDLCTEATIRFYGKYIGSGYSQGLLEPLKRNTSGSENISTTRRGATYPSEPGHISTTRRRHTHAADSAMSGPEEERFQPTNPQTAHERINNHDYAMFNLHQLYIPDGGFSEHKSDSIPGLMDIGFLAPMLQIYSTDEDSNSLWKLMLRVLGENKRSMTFRISWINLLFDVFQTYLVVLLTTSTFQIDTLQLVWACHDDTQSIINWSMLVLSLLAGICGAFSKSSVVTGHEILHLGPLPSSVDFMNCENCSLIMKPPPGPKFELNNLFDCFQWHKTLSQHRILPRLLSAARQNFRLLLRDQRSRHSMVLVLRPSKAMRPASAIQPFLNIIYGFFQAIMLVFFTFLFGSTVGGDILFTGIFVIVFISLVVISRTYSIYYCQWMEKALGITVIEYDTATELQAIRIILAGMPGVLVEGMTFDYVYSAGYRLDQYNDCRDHNPPKAISRGDWYPLGFVLGLCIPILSLVSLVIVDYGSVGTSPVAMAKCLGASFVLSLGLGVIGYFDFIILPTTNTSPQLSEAV